MSLAEISQMIWRRAPDYARAVMMAPHAKRGYLFVFLALDIEFYHIRHHLHDENLADLRLAWWENAVNHREQNLDQHQYLRASSEEGIAQADILAVLHAYQNHQESLEIMLKSFARHMDFEENWIDIWINSPQHKARFSEYYAPNMRPILAMIRSLTPWQRLCLYGFGRYSSRER